MNHFKNWVIIDTNTLASYLTQPQLNILIGNEFGDKQNRSIIDNIILDIIARVRSELFYLTVQPEDPSLIPGEVKSSTCHLIIEALFSRIPSLRLSTDQVRNAERAREHIRSLVQIHLKATGNPKSAQGTFNNINSIVGKSREKRVETKNLKGL